MKLSYYFFFLLSAFSLAACQPRMYFPERANTPGFKGAGEFKGTFSGKIQSADKDSAAGKNKGGSFSPDIDLAYSITDHFAVLGSYHSLLNRYIKQQTLNPYPLLGDFNTFGGLFNGNYEELGAGYFNEYGRIGRFEIFAGYGTGDTKRVGNITPQYNYTTDYNRFFIQPAFGFSGDIFSLSAGFKVILQKYSNFQSNDPDLKYYISTLTGTTPTTDVTHQLYTFVQPFINMEVGYKYARFNMQLGYSKEINSGYISGNFPIYMTIGATFSYAPRHFKKRPDNVIYNNAN